jgi:hypothetical protein
MSVIVKGMDMPENCLDCQFSTDLGDCYATFSAGADFDIPNRPENCPLVKLPENHGRLIDADAFVECLENEFKRGYENDQKSDADMKMLIAKMHELIITEIQKRPTVVESEE